MANPAVVSQIAVSDIESMVYLETQCRRQLYPKEQLQETEAFFGSILNKLGEAFNKRDIFSVPGELDRLISYLRILPETEYVSDFIEEANRDHVRLSHVLNHTIWVVGDSHVNFFSGNEELSFIPIGNDINTCRQVGELPFSVFHLGPCLAFNANKYGTTSRFREKLEYLLANVIEEKAKIMFTMGEIDIRAHVFKETEKQGCSFEAIVDGILENYVDMMKSVRDKGYTVSCFGPIASQSDGVPADEEVFTRFGTEEDRNRATGYFTHRLEEMLKIESIPFLSVFEQMVSEDGYTKYQYLCPDLCHLGQAALPLVKEELRQKGIL